MTLKDLCAANSRTIIQFSVSGSIKNDLTENIMAWIDVQTWDLL